MADRETVDYELHPVQHKHRTDPYRVDPSASARARALRLANSCSECGAEEVFMAIDDRAMPVTASWCDRCVTRETEGKARAAARAQLHPFADHLTDALGPSCEGTLDPDDLTGALAEVALNVGLWADLEVALKRAGHAAAVTDARQRGVKMSCRTCGRATDAGNLLPCLPEGEPHCGRCLATCLTLRTLAGWQDEGA